MAIAPMTLRLKRSATVPVTSTSRAAGRNSAKPSKPMSNSRPVMSYTCLPRTVACNITPADVNTLEPKRLRTGATRNSARVLLTAVVTSFVALLDTSFDSSFGAGSPDISGSP